MSSTSTIRRSLRRTLAAVVLGLVAIAGTATAAGAATTFSASGSWASVSGSTVTAGLSLSASSPVTVEYALICVRDDQNRNYDFPASSNKALGTTASAIGGTRSFPAGTFKYFACVKTDGLWRAVGAVNTFTVSASSAIPAAKPGWTRTFSDDFNTNVAQGSFPGPYAGRWSGYDGFRNSYGTGDYNQKIISVHDGLLDVYLHPENGRPQTAAPVPLVNGSWTGQVYGRYSVRMKSDPVRGYGAAFLLWSDTNNWNDGEIDFPESGLHDVARGFNHCPGNPSKNCHWFYTDKRYSDWHTYTIEWTKDKISFLVDEQVVSSTTSGIPSKPMHWVMQLESPEGSYAAQNSGHLVMDWVTIDKVS